MDGSMEGACLAIAKSLLESLRHDNPSCHPAMKP